MLLVLLLLLFPFRLFQALSVSCLAFFSYSLDFTIVGVLNISGEMASNIPMSPQLEQIHGEIRDHFRALAYALSYTRF